MQWQKRWLDIRNRGRYRRRQREGIVIDRRLELISITGNRSGLMALRAAIDSALQPPRFQSECRQYDIIGAGLRIVVKARDLSPDTEQQRSRTPK